MLKNLFLFLVLSSQVCKNDTEKSKQKIIKRGFLLLGCVKKCANDIFMEKVVFFCENTPTLNVYHANENLHYHDESFRQTKLCTIDHNAMTC